MNSTLILSMHGMVTFCINLETFTRVQLIFAEWKGNLK